jgi:hypothetical protein
MDSRFAILASALGVAAVTSCSEPFKGFDPTPVEPPGEEICASSREWLPNTPKLEMFKPQPHPAGECPFYRGGWQNFLIATQPDENGVPALRNYPTIDTLFTPAKPHGANRAFLGDIKQAGQREILIDQNGHSLYYGIHVNEEFAKFIRANKLTTADALRKADPTLFFPAGVVEFKSAWQEVPDNDPTLKDYIWMKAPVATIKKVNGELVEDRDNPREITVRLLALHVVFTLPGHPEFIWATFEHSLGAPDTMAADGKRNVAPTGGVNPVDTDPNNQNDETVVCMDDHLLCKNGTKANQGNKAIPAAQLNFDEKTQSFPGQETSIYRMFPASKSNTIDPDDAITSLNHNVEAIFADAEAKGELSPRDKRGHYRLVGAQWMDKPAEFALNRPLQNDRTSPYADKTTDTGLSFEESIRTEGADSSLSILAGEDRLSSTAMESFTQAPDAFPNCFSCHNTQAVTAKGVPIDRDRSGVQLLEPKLLNVSHVLSQFLLEESQAQ